jgi:hypothetical protein
MELCVYGKSELLQPLSHFDDDNACALIVGVWVWVVMVPTTM